MSTSKDLHLYIKTLLDSANWSLRSLVGGCSADEKQYHQINMIINSWSALEGFINLIFIVAKPSPKLVEHEIAFLEEKELKVNENGEFHEVTSYQATTKKILFILNKFSSINTKHFKQSNLWNHIKIAENYRNDLIHAKMHINENSYDLKKSRFVNSTVIETIKLLNRRTLKIRHLQYPI